MRALKLIFIFGAAAVLLQTSICCSSQRKLSKIRNSRACALISLPEDTLNRLALYDSLVLGHSDTVLVDSSASGVTFLMKATRDEEGDVVASDAITAAAVTARFRNVAERNGKVTIEFQIRIPSQMQDALWQLRLRPTLVLLGDTTSLERVIITGESYRRSQLRGYQQYERFLSRIISDSTKFIDLFSLELFLQRNLPEVFAFKSDTSFISDERFSSAFGVTQAEAVEHYTNSFAIKMNDRLKSRKARMYARYVRSPIISEGIRLDTVIRSLDGDFVYNYAQTFATRPSLRKAEIFLEGDIYEQDVKLYHIPCSGPLTYYISSLSAFVDDSPRYQTEILERRVSANTACRIDFATGKSDIDVTLGVNLLEINRIKSNLRDLIENISFDLDSIVISASASPEGSERSNNDLSARRAASAARYFEKYMMFYVDSVRLSAAPKICFKSRSAGENWTELDRIVRFDTTLLQTQKSQYYALAHIHNLDERERKLSQRDFYPYIREKLYPRLRVVNFDFHLHRKGMVKDTIHTTRLDSVYMSGIKALKDRDYKLAVDLLRPYGGYNLAIAYCSLDYNASALGILEKLPDRTSRVNYMLAVIYSRTGREPEAVRCYKEACLEDEALIRRGKLDPEISALIARFHLE